MSSVYTYYIKDLRLYLKLSLYSIPVYSRFDLPDRFDYKYLFNNYGTLGPIQS